MRTHFTQEAIAMSTSKKNLDVTDCEQRAYLFEVTLLVHLQALRVHKVAALAELLVGAVLRTHNAINTPDPQNTVTR